MTDINKIPDGHLFALAALRYRVTVTNEDTGEVIYSHASHGGILCSVESYKLLKQTEEIEGNQQHFMWGHPAVIGHASVMHHERLRELATKDKTFMERMMHVFKE